MRSHQLKLGKKVTEERRRARKGSRAGSLVAQTQKGPASGQVASTQTRKGEEGLEAVGLARGGKRGWARIGLGQPGVLLEPAGAESVYLVSH